jgi:uncharacterized membrane protein
VSKAPGAPRSSPFGPLLLLALVGPFSIDAKRRRAPGQRWEPFVAVTSSVPFAAVVQGRVDSGERRRF